MDTHNPRKRPITVWLCGALIALTAGWFIYGANWVRAVTDSEGKPPSWGLAAGQSARLNVVNCADDQSFSIDWRFLDNAGRVIARTPEPHLVPPGRTMSFDINGDILEVPRDPLGRIQMRAVVVALGGPDTFERFGEISIEVIDNATGRSSIFISAAAAKGCSNNL